MSKIVNLIWDLAKDDWWKKIIASGIIASIIITYTIYETTDGENAGTLIPISIVCAFIFGSFIASYLLTGAYLNKVFNNPSNGLSKPSIYLASGLYAVSLIPVAGLIIYGIFMIITIQDSL